MKNKEELLREAETVMEAEQLVHDLSEEGWERSREDKDFIGSEEEELLEEELNKAENMAYYYYNCFECYCEEAGFNPEQLLEEAYSKR